MAVKFIRERKKQKYLIIIFGVIIIITLIVLWFGFFKGKKFISGPVVIPPTMEEIKIEFKNLENPLLIELHPFEKIPSPFPGAKDVPLKPTLTWESVPGAEVYLWEVIGVESGKTDQTSVTLSKELKPATTYIWRVKSCNKDMTDCSAWSSRDFLTASVLFPPKLVSPSTEEEMPSRRENPFLPYLE